MNKNITFISGNNSKIKEFRNMLEPHVEMQVLDIDLPEIQSLDPKEVIEDKLNRVKQEVEWVFFVEDTCLVIDAYSNWLPGPLIKWFIKDREQWLQNIVDYTVMKNNLSATAITTIGLHINGKNHFFKWEIEWNISKEVKWSNSFGWDDIFIPAYWAKTFWEMNVEEKNNYSMRQIAANQMVKYILENK